ncbi:site-specific DNA-methyltransferase [Candidatus Saccharibacteria bacterium]|nr:site-specific DNA-methyltransferase [Candidatus Saccharibacteria bacterium]
MKLINDDCLIAMKDIEDGSVDMVLTDPPYGTTACKWDSIIPLEQMWKQLKRVIKPNGAIVMTASQPFTTTLIASNMKMFKYCWVRDKKLGGNSMLVKYQPYRVHEDIAVFGDGKTEYYPLMETRGKERIKNGKTKNSDNAFNVIGAEKVINNVYYPRSILEISNAKRTGRVHPTQKPVALMEYLIKTYTNEGETVLDFAMGSGTTGVACANLNRDFIGIEKDLDYFNIAKARIENAITANKEDK